MDKSSEVKTIDNVENFTDFLNVIKSKVKGEEPIDIKEKCLPLCQKYLAGQWTQLTIDDIEIKRLTGGIANQTYYCKALNSSEGEPQINEVVVRFYGTNQKTFEMTDKYLHQAIVSNMASDNGLGPKIYGLFSEGQIQKYYPHKLPTEMDMYDQDLMLQLPRKLAQFQCMSPPMERNESIFPKLLSFFSQNLEQILVKRRNLFKESNCKTLLECNLKEELDWVLNLLNDLEYPVVLCHGDFKFGNLLITEDKQIVLTDFDTSSYFYRGWDFCFIFNYLEIVGKNCFEYKDEPIVKAFISEYIIEMEKLLGKQYSDNESNTLDNILRETKVISMVFSLYQTLLFIFNTETFKTLVTEKSSLAIAEDELVKYLAKKRVLTSMNIL